MPRTDAIRLHLLLAVALSLAACDDTEAPADDAGVEPAADAAPTTDAGPREDAGPPPDGAAPDPGTPCDVRELLSARCHECHSDPPRFGAPMPLVTPADFARPSISDPSRAVRELVRERAHRTDGTRMPPPPRDAVAGAELAALDAWIDAATPAAPEGTVCEDVPPPPGGCVGPDCLPCTPSHTFTAHGASLDAPFEVPTEANAYRCFAFPSPFAASSRATAWAPIVDDARVLHHLIVYRTRTRQTPGPVPCEMPLDAVGLFGWAPGSPNVVLPDDVGLELSSGAEEWLILQVHYWNVAGHTDARDRSGFAACTVDTPRALTAGVMTFGSTAIAIAPRARAQEVAGLCPSTGTALLREPLHVLANAPHMHGRGRRFVVEVLRGGWTSETVLDVDPFRFDDQRAYWHDPPYEIRPGDAVRTRCIYDNPDASWTYYGERTEDEMCFDFAIVYPIDAIPAGYPRTCLTTLGL